MRKFHFLIVMSLFIISCNPSQKIPTKVTGHIAGNTTYVIAHRGAWKLKNLPENSIPALKEAINLNCYGSEMDVHMTADGYLVVNHDPQFHKIDIQHANLADLRKFKLSNGDEFPLLADFLQVIVQQNKTKLIIEIKPSIRGKEWALATARKVTTEISKFQSGAHVEYISFDFDICKEVLKIVPTAKVQYLKGDKTPDEIKSAGLSGLGYNQKVFQEHPAYIPEARNLGLLTNAWTVNDPVIMDWLIDRGIDFITTNEPELLIEKLKIPATSSVYVKFRNSRNNYEKQFIRSEDKNYVDVNEVN